MKKILWITFCLIVLVMGSVFAQTNSLTFSTYYPAPYGAYDRLRLVPYTSASPLPEPCEIGTLYVRQTGTSPNETSELKMCRNDGTGSGEWVPLVGVWTQNGTDVYLTDESASNPLSVGIGTESPASKLHVSGGTGSADVLIEADTDGDSSGKPSLTLSQDGGVVKGKLYFDASDNLSLEAQYSASSLEFITAGSPRMVIDPNGRVGINEESPEALLEISQDGADTIPPFMLSSDDDTDGDILRVDDAGDILINFLKTETPNLNGKLVIKSDNTDDAEIAFVLDGGADGTYDIMYDGGTDGNVYFTHTGTSADDSVVFSHYDSGILTPLAEINNYGIFHVSKKLGIQVAPADIHEAVELHVHEEQSGQDVTVVLSDEGTSTGFSDPNFPYINTQTIGVMMPHKSMTGAGGSSTLGGLQIVGISDGATTPEIPGLSLVGALGNTDPGNIPAIDISGFKLDGSGGIDVLADDDITMGVNLYSTISNSYFMVTANGNVGIGFESFDSNRPTQKLHVNGLARLEPMESAPTTPYCPANGSQNGSIYADTSGELCFCHDGVWYEAGNGPGTCN